MKKQFFRKDLNLENRWWHRLLSIVFISLFLIFIAYNVAIFSTADIFRGGQIQQWNKNGALSERIVSEVKPISAFVEDGEKIGENEGTFTLNDRQGEYYNGILNDVYCSTELSNNLEHIKSERKVKNLFIRNLFGTNDVPLETFTNYIKQNNIRCIIVDAYTTYDSSGQIDGKLSFLEPTKEYQDNWSFYEKSPVNTAIYFLEMILTVIAISVVIFAIIILIYYKIVLYIIFGNDSNNSR